MISTSVPARARKGRVELLLRRSLPALFLSASLLACTTPAHRDAMAVASPALNDLTSFALMRIDQNGRSSSVLSVDQLADTLKDSDVVFFGEWHDHPGNHLAEMALFRALHQRSPQLVLSLEMFERDVQPVVDDYMASRIGEEALQRRGRAWSNYAESYRPLIEYAKENGLAVIAAEVPTRVVRCVGQEGPEFLSHLRADQRNWAAAELHLDGGAYRDKFFRFLAEDNGHGEGAPTDMTGAPTPAALRSFAAQVTRDDTMAESIFLYLQKHPGQKVMHITGAFHVEGFLGTVERLKLRAPGMKIAVVAPAEADDPKHPEIAARDMGNGNYAVLLRSLPKSYVNDAEMKAAMPGPMNVVTARRCDL
jgi:uncharacterized iron-regulated protein